MGDDLDWVSGVVQLAYPSMTTMRGEGGEKWAIGEFNSSRVS